MDAWSILKDNATLDTGDAWVLLNNQNTGTGTGTGDGEIVYVNSGGGGGTVYVDKKLPTVIVKKIDKKDNKINININGLKEE